MVQLRQVSEEFGRTCGEAFGRSILGGPAAATYFGALQLVSRVLGQLPIVVQALLLEVSLYGNFQDTDPNRLHYPTDLLISLLGWMNERGVFRLHRPLRQEEMLPYVIGAIDEYFRARQGGPLQAMVRQATVANRGVLEALTNDLTAIEQAAGRSNPFCRCVLDVFADFIASQEAFSSKVVNDLPWYASYGYVSNRFECPVVPMYIESRLGIPIDATISRLYYVQSERRLYLTPAAQAKLKQDGGKDALTRYAMESAQTADELRAEIARDVRTITKVAPGYEDTIIGVEPGTLVLRSGFVLSPRGDLTPPRRDCPDLNLTLWQRYYDQTYALRLFLEGPDRGMPHTATRDILCALDTFHTKVFTSSGLMDSMAVDPFEVPRPVRDALSTLASLKQKRGRAVRD
jgi:hypothetical protein